MGHELLSELWTLQLTTRIRGGLYITVRFAVFIIVRIVGGWNGSLALLWVRLRDWNI
jgi:hypothetical protein